MTEHPEEHAGISRGLMAPYRHEFAGIYAAVITPVDGDGRPDEHALTRILDFVLQGGVDGVCIGGATGEYPRFTMGERKRIVEATACHLDGRAPFVAAVGAPTLRDVIGLGEHALAHGSRSVLIPMPYFYTYRRQDLRAYVRAVVGALDGPCLLYNLPAFTNPIEPETSIELLGSEPNLVGIKDSSGNRAALERLAGARDKLPDFALLCGSDGLLLDALEAGWDGAISGIASCAPELLAALYARRGEREATRRSQRRLDELVGLVERLPFPLSLRVACEVRGLKVGPPAWPLAAESEIDGLRTAYARWFDEHLSSDDLTR